MQGKVLQTSISVPAVPRVWVFVLDCNSHVRVEFRKWLPCREKKKLDSSGAGEFAHLSAHSFWSCFLVWGPVWVEGTADGIFGSDEAFEGFGGRALRHGRFVDVALPGHESPRLSAGRLLRTTRISSSLGDWKTTRLSPKRSLREKRSLLYRSEYPRALALPWSSRRLLFFRRLLTRAAQSLPLSKSCGSS